MLAIFILALCTENFLSSSGFESRKDIFGCLVKYLKDKNVTDDNFDVAESLKIVEEDCPAIVAEKRQSFYVDLKARLACSYPVYNATFGLCELVKKPFCVNETVTKIGNETVSNVGNETVLNVGNGTLLNVGNETTKHPEAIDCYNLTSVKPFNKNITEASMLPQFHDQSVDKCAPVEKCYDCILDVLSSNEYEETRFHTAAVDFTIIEFQIWKYYSIAPRVIELTEKGRKLENEALMTCVDQKVCLKDVKFCEIEKEAKIGH